jgi:pimeloyl-ACP methyl ester carboxylesterase
MPERLYLPDVVVLLPGITGSVLEDGDGKVVWGYSAGTIAKALFTGGANIRKALALPHEDLDRDELDDGIRATGLMPDLHILPGLWKIDGYTAIVDMLLATFELTEGRNFFRFPYDWRRDNRVSARKLARAAHGWLKAWRDAGHPNAKLILLAHSMGGLVSRWFLENMEGWKDTRALITFGTPYRGSLNSLDSLANGMKKGPLDLSDLVRQFPSVYQLLPVFECWDDGSGQLKRVGETSGIPNVDAARAARALNDFHRKIEAAVKTNRDLDAFKTGGYTICPVVGIAQKTYLTAKAGGAGGVELSELHGGQALGGDGTVPRVSAIPIEMSGQPAGPVYAATQHGSLQNADAVLAHLHGLLSGTTIDLGNFLKPKVQVALEVDDVLEAGQPLLVRARPVRPDVALDVVVRGGDGQTQRAPLTAGLDGWFSATFAPPAPGVYRVRVQGKGVETAEDSLVVAEPV